MASLRLATSRILSRTNHRPKIKIPSIPSHSLTLSRTLFTKKTPPPPRSPIRTALYATALTVSLGLFTVYYLDARSGVHRYVFGPVIRFVLSPENGQKVAVKVLGSGLGSRDFGADDERLKVKIWDYEVSNPVGLAAGFDKEGEAIDGLFNLGFSWVEIGSVTPKPQPGNPRPRVFRLPEDGGLINRYGFPSQGHASVLARLRARVPSFLSEITPPPSTASFREGALLAVNLGKNKDSPVDSIEDFVAGVRTFGPYSDVLVVNVSSPNTPGLRGLQNKDLLKQLLDGVTEARDKLAPVNITSRKPRLVLKIAPDLDESHLRDIAEVIRGSSIDAVIVSNTTTQRPASLTSANKVEFGGLSGVPLKPYSLATLRTLRTHLPASIPLIGCGGITTGEDAIDYAKAGASLVQVYTAFGYDGVGACRRIKDQIVEILEKEGTTWEGVVDKAVKELSLKEGAVKGGSVGQLIAEAEELNVLLDKLGAKLGVDATKIVAVPS